MRLWKVVLLSLLVSGCNESEEQQCVKTLVAFHDYTGIEARSFCVGYYKEQQQLTKTRGPNSENQDRFVALDFTEQSAIDSEQVRINQQKNLARSDDNFLYWLKM